MFFYGYGVGLPPSDICAIFWGGLFLAGPSERAGEARSDQRETTEVSVNERSLLPLRRIEPERGSYERTVRTYHPLSCTN